jgi:predicted AAA+ superfamily ATPase
LTEDLLSLEKGRLFEHAVILEIIRRIRSGKDDYKVHYWRTSGGAEVDCIIDTGVALIPIEIKAGKRVSLSYVRGIVSFIQTYPELVKNAYVITNGRLPEKLSDKITALPWSYL